MIRQGQITQIAQHYGWVSQCKRCVEEMAELTLAFCKFDRAETCEDAEKWLDNIVEELADVEIMVRQIKLLTGRSADVEIMINQKLDRQLDRIKREKEKSTC